MFWEYDTRLGRRWNVDTVVKQWESPYACFRNNPIYHSDPSGLDCEPANNSKPDVGVEPPITLKTFEVKAHRMGWFERAWRNVVGVAKRVDNWFNNNLGVHV